MKIAQFKKHATNIWRYKWDGKYLYVSKNPFCPSIIACGFGNGIPGKEMLLSELPQMLKVDRVELED